MFVFEKRRKAKLGYGTRKRGCPPLPNKETRINGLFSSVKDLLATNFLEGLRVDYIFKKHRVKIPGIITGDGYICGCKSCKYKKVVSALELEKHANVSSNQASNHIVLTNGRTLHEIVKHLSTVPKESLKWEIERMIGQAIDRDHYNAWLSAQTPGDAMVTTEAGNAKLNAASSSEVSTELPRNTAYLGPVQQSSKEGIGSHNSQFKSLESNASISNEPFLNFTSTQNKKMYMHTPNSLLGDVQGLLATGLLVGVPVKYRKADLELHGYIADVGICCGCSNCKYEQVVSSLTFEKHARSKSSNQNGHIFLNSGLSLYALVKVLGNVSLGSLGELIEENIGCPANMEVFNAWKESFHTTGSDISVISNATHVSGLQIHGEINSKKKHSELDVSRGVGNHTSRRGMKIDRVRSLNGHKQSPYGFHVNDSIFSFPKGIRSSVAKRAPSKVTARNQGVEQPSQSMTCYVGAQKERELDRPTNMQALESLSGTTMSKSNASNTNGDVEHNLKGLLPCIALEKNEETLSKYGTKSSSYLNSFVLTDYLEMTDFNYNRDGGLQSSVAKRAPSKVITKNQGVEQPSQSMTFYVGAQKKRGVDMSRNIQTLGNSCEIASSESNTAKNNGDVENNLRVLSPCLTSVKNKSALSNYGPMVSSCLSSFLPTKFSERIHLNYQKDGVFSLQVFELFNESDVFVQKSSSSEDGTRLTQDVHGRTTSSEASRMTNHTSSPSQSASLIHSLFPHAKNVQSKRAASNSVHQLIFNFLEDETKLCYRSRGKELLIGYKSGKGIVCSCCSALENLICNSNTDQSMKATDGHCSSSDSCRAYVLQTPCDSSVCMLCRDDDATLNIGNICDSTMMLCGQCSKMFHLGCLRQHAISDVKERPSPYDSWFCGDGCKKIREKLLELIHGGPRVIHNAMLNSLKSICITNGLLDEAGAVLPWQILSGRFQGDKSSPLLGQAMRIFQENFSAVYKQNRDVLPVMVKGEKGIAEFFGGMLCTVVTIKSFIVSAGLLRVFGRQVAELPLVVTPKAMRRKGCFKILFSKIEEMLRLLEVERLIVPADDATMPIWMTSLASQSWRIIRLLFAERIIE